VGGLVLGKAYLMGGGVVGLGNLRGSSQGGRYATYKNFGISLIEREAWDLENSGVSHMEGDVGHEKILGSLIGQEGVSYREEVAREVWNFLCDGRAE
jgi:hypothetical protein